MDFLTPLTWIDLLAAGAVGAGAGWLAHALFRSRWRRRIEDLPGPASDSRGDLTSQSASFPASEARSPIVASVPGTVSEGANTAGRVILHLYSLGRLGPDDVAPTGLTQKGIGEVLALRQGSLAKTLARLGAAGVTQVERRHVAGESRRLKVYRLTAQGESVARELRRRPVGDPVPSQTKL